MKLKTVLVAWVLAVLGMGTMVWLLTPVPVLESIGILCHRHTVFDDAHHRFYSDSNLNKMKHIKYTILGLAILSSIIFITWLLTTVKIVAISVGIIVVLTICYLIGLAIIEKL